uniref:glutarate dioxygenase GlaH n=1 Tax=uncultured Caulobacter sp. TaxID=158749 RepID=UPI0025D25EBF|nr:glutarate dioxygenase GlaH [uncultured Caulobacter sp.]
MNAPSAISPPFSQAEETAFVVGPHPHHPRLRHIELKPSVLAAFVESVAQVDVQNLQYVPFMRYKVAEELQKAFGGRFASTLRQLTADRETGGFTLGVGAVTDRRDDYVRMGTAIGHLLGPSNHDAMSGTYFARFLVKDTDNSDSYLRQAYRLFTLHTDGTFVSEATDWLLMMKFAEDNAVGGESRFLHIDDWAERDSFVSHPMGRLPFAYKAPGSKNVDEHIERPVFFDSEFGLSMSFIDQFVQPRSMEEALYLHDLSSSMERSPGTREVPLPVGDLVVLNNYFWLHGRAPFEKNPALHRELMRQRGMFAR